MSSYVRSMAQGVSGLKLGSFLDFHKTDHFPRASVGGAEFPDDFRGQTREVHVGTTQLSSLSPKSFAFLTCAGFWPPLWLLCVSSACPSHSSPLSLACCLYRSKASNYPLASCKPLPLLSLLTPFPQVTPNPQETQQVSFHQKTPPFRRGVLITTVQKENLLKAKTKENLVTLEIIRKQTG